jgi:hypothetical protein
MSRAWTQDGRSGYPADYFSCLVGYLVSLDRLDSTTYIGKHFQELLEALWDVSDERLMTEGQPHHRPVGLHYAVDCSPVLAKG